MSFSVMNSSNEMEVSSCDKHLDNSCDNNIDKPDTNTAMELSHLDVTTGVQAATVANHSRLSMQSESPSVLPASVRQDNRILLADSTVTVTQPQTVYPSTSMQALPFTKYQENTTGRGSKLTNSEVSNFEYSLTTPYGASGGRTSSPPTTTMWGLSEGKGRDNADPNNVNRDAHPADLVNASTRAVGISWSSSNVSSMYKQQEGAPTCSFSGNMTENVRVDSSFHVAEIVGKQGVKIKKIRANTNTWIKTPARGQDPVFIISGRKEGVEQAKQEILASAAKVARLRELRGKQGGDIGLSAGREHLSRLPSQETEYGAVQIKVIVPAYAVGLLMGANGSKVREIALSTNTHIKSLAGFQEHVLEIRGRAEDVAAAREEIITVMEEKQDKEYLRRLMTQLPIHESKGHSLHSPTPSTSLPTHTHSFTRIRPFNQLAASPSSAVQPAGTQHMYADLLTHSAAPATPITHLHSPLAPLHVSKRPMTTGPSATPSSLQATGAPLLSPLPPTYQSPNMTTVTTVPPLYPHYHHHTPLNQVIYPTADMQTSTNTSPTNEYRNF